MPPLALSTTPDAAPANPAAVTNTLNKPKFPPDESGFFNELRRRVGAYFAEGRSERDCWQMYLKTAAILTWLATSYVLLVFVADSLWLAAPLALACGMGIAAVGFAIQHDGGHHAYSRHEWINRLAAISLDMIGASSYLWRWKHGVLHHTYTNIDGQDTDIEPGAVARLAPHQKRRWFHRWQQLYLIPLYGITTSRWHLYGDYKEVMFGYINSHKIPRPKGWDLVVFLAGKVFSTGFLLILPMCFHPWWLVLAFYFVVTGIVGVFITIVFQLAHCVEEADYPLPEPDSMRMPDAWAAHQVRTTVDFARSSRLLSWLLGGLNFQVEHHLFPRICHIHYPALSKIVEQTCKEFGVPYSSHGTFLDGFRSHYRWLKRLGRPDAELDAIAAA